MRIDLETSFKLTSRSDDIFDKKWTLITIRNENVNKTFTDHFFVISNILVC